MTTVALNDVEIYYEVHGVEGAPWVLNIGGTGGDLRQTFPGSSPLNKQFRVLHYDQRGLGQTSSPVADYTMSDYADDAAALIEDVIGRRCHVVGTSFGGMVALNLAVQHPQLIDKLALLCTSPGGAHPSYPFERLDEMEPDLAFETRMRLFDTRWDPRADEPIPGLGVVYDIVAERARAVPDPAVVAGLARQLAARAGHDVVDALASIEHETLVCAGTHDGTAPLANSALIAAQMPNARLETFEAGHLLGYQDRAVWPTVVDFLNS